MYSIQGNIIPEENRMHVAIWEFRKKFYRAENTDMYFEAVAQEAEKILKKYPTKLCFDLIWAEIRDFERRAKMNDGEKERRPA